MGVVGLFGRFSQGPSSASGHKRKARRAKGRIIWGFWHGGSHFVVAKLFLGVLFVGRHQRLYGRGFLRLKSVCWFEIWFHFTLKWLCPNRWRTVGCTRGVGACCTSSTQTVLPITFSHLSTLHTKPPHNTKSPCLCILNFQVCVNLGLCQCLTILLWPHFAHLQTSVVSTAS